MYKLSDKKLGYVKLSPDFSVFCERINKEEFIYKISTLPSGNNLELISMPELWLVGFSEDFMIVSYFNDVTKIYSKEDFYEIFQFESIANIENIGEDDIYICLNGIIYKYNKIKNKLQQFDTGESRNFYWAHGKIVLFAESDNRINLCKILENTIESIWRIDTFNDLFPEYNLKGNEDFPFRISEIKVYNGDFIVVTTAGIARLDALTGKTIWKTEKLRCKWIEIVEQIGYISGGNKLSKVNLNTGEISGYGWDIDILPNIEYEGNQYIAWGARFVYNDRLLWYSSNSGGAALIVAIDPKDGSYVWVEKVDSEHIYEPQFHEDKMYISDINGNLFIYQKQD